MGNITAYTSFGTTLNVLLAMTQAPLRHCTLNRVSVAEVDSLLGCGLLKQFKMITVPNETDKMHANWLLYCNLI